MGDYIRVACAVPDIRVGDVKGNTDAVCDLLVQAEKKNCDVVVFPELCLTGYTCGDLFFQQSLLHNAQTALRQIAEHTDALTAVVGLPVRIDGKLFNCAAVVSGGSVKGLVVKTFIPNYDVAKERRWFVSGEDLHRSTVALWELGLDGEETIPAGTDILFRLGDGAMLGVEICEDLWAPVSRGSILALQGAEVIVNPAASHALAGRRTHRRDVVKQSSEANLCIYGFCSAGCAESAQDLIYSGHSVIAQCGKVLAENAKPMDSGYLMVCDGDLGVVRGHRIRNTTFHDACAIYAAPARVVATSATPLRSDGRLHRVEKMPFAPSDPEELRVWCGDVFDIQVTGLMRRLELLQAKPVLGISGGLDSTLALLVAVEAVRRLGWSVDCVHGLTMPCFGTSDRTYRNAHKLMAQLGITVKEINICEAVTGHFRDIGQDPSVHDTTYENAQARERTQILMDYAGMVGGIVVGTGDLSELALGWCTYNGDHMSMYSVNSSVPKTAIPLILDTVAQMDTYTHTRDTLADVIATPISPELLPPDDAGQIAQQTQNVVGPYELHDFFLFYMLCEGFGPEKILSLACRTFAKDYDTQTVKNWLKVFYRRFFSQQFKRNCQPDGVRTGALGFSPRSGWQMPSDASAALWLEEVDRL